jgi:predicted nucleotidyltransferase
MLNFTKKQGQILEIFFNDPEKSYYFRQLARLLKVEPGVFQKDINNLVQEGILTSEFQANSRFFQLNKKYALYPEIKSILFKTVGAEGQLRTLFAKNKNIHAAFIFGSYAKGEEDFLSDIDVMLIGNINEKEFLSGLKKIEDKLKREINYHIYSSDEWRKKIIDKFSFVGEVVKKPKIFLIGDEKNL